MTEPKIPPEALQPSGRTPESLPQGVGDPGAASSGQDSSNAALPTKDELPQVKNPIPPG